QVPVNAAKQNSPRVAVSISTARPVNTAAPKPKVNDALPTTYSYFKAHSLVKRTFNQKSAAKTNKFNEKVNTARVNNVTNAGPKEVVSAAMGNGGSYMLKRFDYVDLQGRLKNMTGDKSFLIDDQEVDGGFVAFAGNSPFDLESFFDSDYAGASLDRKSTTGGCQFLGKRLISWKCKKQTIVANSTTEAEYVATANCYRQMDVFKEWGRRNEKGCIASSLEAEQDSGSGPRCQVTILGMQKLKLAKIAIATSLDSRESYNITANRMGKFKLVSKDLSGVHLKLEDSDGITTFPNTKIFEQLTLMGSPTYTNVANKAAFTSVDVVHGGAATTVSSIDAG
ncbi:hypothetical protein Tco_0590854, partial [Tanacetum coccineum]